MNVHRNHVSKSADAKSDETLEEAAEGRREKRIFESGDARNQPAVTAGYGRISRPPSADGAVRSIVFDPTNLKKVVDEIKVIEEGIRTIIAQRTTKTVTEQIPVEKTRRKPVGLFGRLLLFLRGKPPEMETYTDYETVETQVPREPDEVLISEFHTMIDQYIQSLTGLNEGLRGTVTEVESIVKNLTDVSDVFTERIHRDRRAFQNQMEKSRALEKQLADMTAVYEAMSPLHDRYAEVEKAVDHLEMDLRDSQGTEMKLKTAIDMGVKYQHALKSYRRLINDFKERGDLHVNMVERFSEGAGHMKIAVDNVSQICAGVANVTQSMITIVESIDDGNRVLGRYASLIGDRFADTERWRMEYSALKEAEAVYRKNDEHRLTRLEDNRREIEDLLGTASTT